MKKSDVWVRHVMDGATRRLVESINPEERDVFEVSGQSWRNEFKWKTYSSSAFPDFDICENSFDRTYDLIIAEQVFEHIRHPIKAMSNIYNALNSGGCVLITTPFMYHIHPTPIDCWRWTPQGLRFLMEDGGFDLSKTSAAGWGNLECFLQHTIDRARAPAYHVDHPLHNQNYIPQVVWGLAQK